MKRGRYQAATVASMVGHGKRTGALRTVALCGPNKEVTRQGTNQKQPRVSANCAKGLHNNCSMDLCTCPCATHRAAK